MSPRTISDDDDDDEPPNDLHIKHELHSPRSAVIASHNSQLDF